MRALLNQDKKLKLVDDFAEPERRKGEVKVRVHYASLNPTDIDIANGDYDLFLRLYRVKSPIRTGLEFSGTVIEASLHFKQGDQVFGYTSVLKGPKTHQEILSIPEDYIAKMPQGLSFAEAAAFPLGAQTSLVALRDVAKLKPGQSVLINGASGGLGVFAIQLAKAMELEVTAVAGTDAQDAMAALGADYIVNYKETPLARLKGSFDSVLELSNKFALRDFKHLLAPRGMFIPADPLKHLSGFMTNPFRKQKLGYLMVDRGDRELLTDLANRVSKGELDVSYYREFALEDYQNAIEALETRSTLGRIVLRFD
ncbi:MAG: NAD(P)-dependent alcohol dehydrogenase [Pseudomonadota bacterium]